MTSAALFRLRRDARSEAYCRARAVEYLLARNRIVEAEARLQSAVEDSVIYGEPAMMAARAQFLAAVGQHSEALDSLVQARGQCREPPGGPAGTHSACGYYLRPLPRFGTMALVRMAPRRAWCGGGKPRE